MNRAHVQSVVEEAARRVGVTLHSLHRGSNIDTVVDLGWPQAWHPAPGMGQCYTRECGKHVTWAGRDASVPNCIIALHELAHCAWWHPTRGIDLDDECPLYVWEHRAWRELGGHEMAVAYFESSYTQTSGCPTPDGRDIGPMSRWERPRSSRWWCEARETCMNLGMLTANGEVRWGPPRWSR